MSPATGVKLAPSADLQNEETKIEPTPDQIRQRAFEIYLSRNGAPGDETQDWLQAENELRAK